MNKETPRDNNAKSAADPDRRKFLRSFAEAAGAGFLAFHLALLIPKSARAQIPAVTVSPDEMEKNFCTFVVDTKKCIGCGSCVRACRAENKVPVGYYRTWVERYTESGHHELLVDSPEGGEHGFMSPPEVQFKAPKAFFVPKLCNQCERPPCVQVCPVCASFLSPGGVVLIDKKRCMGCAYCVQACPYEARYIEHGNGVADKCTWCYHRLVRGMLPACVETCPTGARVFSIHKDEKECEVCAVLHKERYGVLKEELGTKPRLAYLGLNKEVR